MQKSWIHMHFVKMDSAAFKIVIQRGKYVLEWQDFFEYGD